MRRIVLGSSLIIPLLIVGGCAHGFQITRIVADLAECAPAEYEAVTGAIRNGGSSWIDVILELAPCVPKVLADLQKQGAIASAERWADQSDGSYLSPSPSPLSHHALRRMRVAERLAAVVNR